MSSEHPIHVLVPDATVAPAKSRHGGWFAEATATTDTGEYRITQHFRLKADAKAWIAQGPETPERPTAVIVDDDGTVIGTRTSFHIGPRR